MARRRKTLKAQHSRILFGVGGGVLALFLFVALWDAPPLRYVNEGVANATSSHTGATLAQAPAVRRPLVLVQPKHLPTPVPLKALYMTSWVAGTPTRRAELVRIADETEINALVIDIKDYTGNIAFLVRDGNLKRYGSDENRIADIDDFIAELHRKGIYVIGRIAVLQDNYLTDTRPDLAIKRASTGAVWRDRKGIAWLDPASQEVWQYTLLLAREAELRGFDEINYDYIRFPSDGEVSDMSYPFYRADQKTKPQAMEELFAHLGSARGELGIPLSADLFGLVTTERSDMNIGQILEDALPHFDYIAPMVYPSHYPPHFNGWANPAAVPAELLTYVLGSAVERARAASTTPTKIRPWLQDFDLGADYDAAMVRAEIDATEKLGLHSWMLWSAANRYTVDALQAE